MYDTKTGNIVRGNRELCRQKPGNAYIDLIKCYLHCSNVLGLCFCVKFAILRSAQESRT